MGLRRRLRALSASVDELDREVTSLPLVSRGRATSLEATIDDGTGCVCVVFSGRRTIRGLDPGRAVVLEGVARRERGRLTLVNPGYTLLP